MNNLEYRIEQGQWRSQKEQSEVARCLLCRMLDADITVEHDTNGAPYLRERPNLHISISHCRQAVAVAVSSNCRVGIDIESRRKISNGLAERVCTPDEQAAINASADPTMTFLRYWTRKEAVLKMRGTGIKGFSSMVEASNATDCTVKEIDCGIDDTVAALATAL